MEFDLFIILLLLILGFIAGSISVICGIGGGVFFVSFMTLILAIPIDIAIDTSVFMILVSSAAGFITYYRDGKIHLKSMMIFGFFSILGGLSCMLLFIFVKIDNTLLKILFASTLLIAGLNMIKKALDSRKNINGSELIDKDYSVKDHDYKSNLPKTVPLFFLAGFTAYLLGIGGGIINIPVLNIILGYPIHNATAISTGIIFLTAISNTIFKAIFGQINYIVGIIIVVGSIFGAIFGAKVSNKMPRMHLQFFVAIVLMLLAIRMYF